MGSIIVETSQGPVQVDISGDMPTPEEQQAIIQQFSPSQASQIDIDLATASKEEIQDYARQRRLAGIDPATGQPLTEDEYISNYKEPGVDYRTGLDSVGGFSRFQFGRMDNTEEKSGYLQGIVGEEGFRVDPLGRHILTQEGRTKLGLGEGRELAIDEEGFSFNDVKEFAGATALPIATGVGASLLASGVGFVPGTLLVAAATAGGKLLDEGIESAQGLQRQSASEIARDTALEGLFGGLGEGIGRGISAIFGRLIKGPGGETNEALRVKANNLIDQKFRPTVAGATSDSFRPVLNRLQSVYEGIFPNEKAALDNLDQVLAQVRAAGIADDSAINNLDEIVKKDIQDFYKTSDQSLADAQTKMDDAVRNEINTVMQNLKDGITVPEDLAQMIRIRKQIFDEDVDRLYTLVNGKLKNQKIIPMKGILAKLEQLSEESVADIGASKFAAQVRALAGEGGDGFATAQELSRIRTGLNDATKNPALLNDVNVGALGALKAAVNDAFDDAKISLVEATTKKPGEFSRLPNLQASMGELGEALNLLQRTNDFYAKNIKRFDNIVVQDIIKQTRAGQMNLKFVFDKLIQEDNPEAFDQLMKAIRGAPTGKALGAETGIVDLDEGAKIIKRRRIGTRTVEEALNAVKNLAPDNPVRRSVEIQARNIEREAATAASFRGNGAEMAESVRQGLSRMYLDQQIKRSLVIDPQTGQEVIDPIKFVANVREKGTTVDKMLGEDLKNVNDILTVLERGKANLAPNVVAQLRSKPLGDALKDLQTAQATRTAVDKDVLINTLNSTSDPEVIAQAVFKNPSSIKQAQKFLGNRLTNVNGRQVPTIELVRDAAMGRILKQVGATVDSTTGGVRLTDDFVEAFKSGRLGNKFQSVLRSYGDETLDAMFGKNAAEGLNQMAETMVSVSNASTAGKGGLAAPQIALALGSISLILNPLATLPAIATYAFMSKALRNPKVLKMMMASRRKNSFKEFMSGKFKSGDPFGQGLQAAHAIAAATTVQGTRMLVDQAAEEAAPVTEEARQQLQPVVQQAMTQIPQITSPMAGTASQVSPILLGNNPATQQLAQSLGRSR